MFQLNELGGRKDILNKYRSIAVVGLSPREDRPSNRVAKYMHQAGYKIIPINPGQSKILGLHCYPNLHTVKEPIEIVNIFRRSDQVLPIVQEAIEIGAKVIWMQERIVNTEAAALAEKAGLIVVMNRCIKVDHSQL